ncbi:MAG TPA: hypothetical protein DCS93_30925 [Microscillaceae bacterium]|nr:hypothetical protein [Microscillaceae bacterium]
MQEILRHALAAIAYRFQKATYKADDQFGTLDLGQGVRTPAELVNHMNNVLQFTIAAIKAIDRQTIHQEGFVQEVVIFKQKLQELDQCIQQNELKLATAKKVLQGPIADVLTHVGQIAMMRRLHQQPIEAESFFTATIETGKFDYF